MFRSCQIIIRELCSFQNYITVFTIQFVFVNTPPQHIPTQHDMLPQHLVCKYELNCEYRNVTLARNKAP